MPEIAPSRHSTFFGNVAHTPPSLHSWRKSIYATMQNGFLCRYSCTSSCKKTTSKADTGFPGTHPAFHRLSRGRFESLLLLPPIFPQICRFYRKSHLREREASESHSAAHGYVFSACLRDMGKHAPRNFLQLLKFDGGEHAQHLLRVGDFQARRLRRKSGYIGEIRMTDPAMALAGETPGNFQIIVPMCRSFNRM